MIAYPSVGQGTGSSRVILDDIVTDRAVNGSIRQRIFYPNTPGQFTVTHTVDTNNKNLLLGHYNSYCSFNGSISGTTLTVSSVYSGYLVPGATITGSTVTVGTTIVSQLTSASATRYGVGTYLVDTSQTVGSAALTGACQGRLSEFNFIWIAENTTHTCRYSVAPSISIIGGDFFSITNKLEEV